ncbi:CueP family metal-binding protein [Saccharomonospora cyanea]|uniref:Secreted protein n=1 Tax=Saccharomonospora cyanea NA-134 TaxID=882082 RepID=H5XDA9_9PSEU|nr:CueP family metal-binding protein [Saccharomonospora cyanea]EHR59189.1 hypothetical protein SaccyDRAFT_0252 [Saccharomonospora cyanea NA-134]
MKRHLIAAGALLLALAGCSTTAPETDQASPGAPTVTTDKAAFLAEHGLEGMDGAQIIDHLDQVPLAQRSTDLMASVRADHLLLADAEREFTIPLPEDRFYLAVAPYVDHTHECYYHSLTTCRGELAGEELRIRIVDDATGETLVEEQVTTFDNGFVGFWLPQGVNGTIEAGYQGRTGRSAFSTTDEGATCLTTLQLTEA